MPTDLPEDYNPQATPAPPPAPVPTTVPGRWPPAAHWAVGCGSGCAMLVLLQGLLIWTSLGMVLRTRAPEGFKAQVEISSPMIVGEKKPAVLTIRNQGTESFMLNGVVSRDWESREIRLTRPQPQPSSPERILFGSTMWMYGERVEPGDTWILTFDAEAMRKGKLRGALEVQVNLGTERVPFTATARESEE